MKLFCQCNLGCTISISYNINKSLQQKSVFRHLNWAPKARAKNILFFVQTGAEGSFLTAVLATQNVIKCQEVSKRFFFFSSLLSRSSFFLPFSLRLILLFLLSNYLLFYEMAHSRPLFLFYFRLINTVDSKLCSI